MKRTAIFTIILVAATSAIGFYAYAQDSLASKPQITADLQDQKGNKIGSTSIIEAAKGVLIRVEVGGLSPGWHGVHIHGTGLCDDASDGFKQAGGHDAHDEEGTHGYLNPNADHTGDLPNMYVSDNGAGKAEFYSTLTKIKDLKDKDGSALIVHAAADDYAAQPAGNSGDRVACAVIGAKQE